MASLRYYPFAPWDRAVYRRSRNPFATTWVPADGRLRRVPMPGCRQLAAASKRSIRSADNRLRISGANCTGRDARPRLIGRQNWRAWSSTICVPRPAG